MQPNILVVIQVTASSDGSRNPPTHEFKHPASQLRRLPVPGSISHFVVAYLNHDLANTGIGSWTPSAMEAENRGPELVAAATLFLVLSLIAVSLRCYVRAVMLRAFGVDDGLSLCSMATFAVYCAFFFQAVSFGAGRHVTDVSDENMALILKCRWFGELFYVISSVLIKYSIGITLLRILVARWQKVTVWILLALVLVFNIFLALVVIFQCRPVEHFWMRILGVTTGTCLSKSLVSTATYLGCSFNMLGDCILGFLPIALVWNMNLKPREKFVVAVILSLGSIACTATIVRTFYVWQLTDSIDPTLGFVDIAIWSTVENGLALTASSIAILRPLARRVFTRYGLFGHTSNYQEPYSRELSSRSRPCFTGCGLRRDAGRHQRGMHSVPDSNDGKSVDGRRESEQSLSLSGDDGFERFDASRYQGLQYPPSVRDKGLAVPCR